MYLSIYRQFRCRDKLQFKSSLTWEKDCACDKLYAKKCAANHCIDLRRDKFEICWVTFMLQLILIWFSEDEFADGVYSSPDIFTVILCPPSCRPSSDIMLTENLSALTARIAD